MCVNLIFFKVLREEQRVAAVPPLPVRPGKHAASTGCDCNHTYKIVPSSHNCLRQQVRRHSVLESLKSHAHGADSSVRHSRAARSQKNVREWGAGGGRQFCGSLSLSTRCIFTQWYSHTAVQLPPHTQGTRCCSRTFAVSGHFKGRGAGYWCWVYIVMCSDWCWV
jgi:hypothetical protein